MTDVKIVTCPDCNGRGTLRTLFVFQSTCPTCNGTGTIIARSKISQFAANPPAFVLIALLASLAFGLLALAGTLDYDASFDAAPALRWIGLSLAMGVLFVLISQLFNLVDLASNAVPLPVVGGCGLSILIMLAGGPIAAWLSASAISMIIPDAVSIDTTTPHLVLMIIVTTGLHVAARMPSIFFGED